MSDDLNTSTVYDITFVPRRTWNWDVFGGKQLVVHMTDANPQPTWRQRIMTRMLFGSVWTRADNQ